MAVKDFKTLEEQMKILKSRGLTIEDETIARRFLQRNNYYRVSGYSLTLRDHDQFYKGTTFQNIIDIYCFDASLRHILLEYIEKIEVAVKSVYSYEFAKKYSPLGYLDSRNFTDSEEHSRIIKKAEGQKEKRLSHEAFLKHFEKNCNGEIPFWAYVDLFTIADISLIYKISHHEIRDSTAGVLGILPSSRALILEKYMHGITIIRNLCAHGSRLYNRLFITKPNLNNAEKNLLLLNEDGSMDNQHLFGYILVMKRLLSIDDFASMKKQICQLNEDIPFVAMKYYGFPKNWKDVI